MIRLDRLGLVVSLAALGLAIGQAVLAAPETSAQGQGAEQPQATDGNAGREGSRSAPQAKAADPYTASRARAEQRRAEAMAERERRYEELRERAAEVGLNLPATPPWHQDVPQPPEPPAMMGPRQSLVAERQKRRDENYAGLRERAAEQGIEMPEAPPWSLSNDAERETHREFMRNLTLEQRRTLRDLRWEQMRERAAERGMELPENPPWEEVKKRAEERKSRWKSYRETVEAMSDEQREASAAIFGCTPFGPDYGEDPVPPTPFGLGPEAPMTPPYGGPGYDQGMPPHGPPKGQPQAPSLPYGSGY